MCIYNQLYFMLTQNLLTTRSQRFNYSWNTIKMKITRRQSKKTTHPLLKNTHVYSTFNPVYIKRNLSYAKKSIQLLEEVSHLHRYPEFIQPKFCEWKKEVDGKIIFAWTGMNDECEGIKDRAEHQHIRSISFTTYVREKISHHLWRQNVCLQRNWCFNMRDCLKVSNCISHINSIGTYLLLVSTIQKVISYLWIFSFQAQEIWIWRQQN